ncbi:MAG: hypothetical protein GTN78_06405 [Gemmatimonadales bacterium]|nr:hypothetical protein [Gemmatimonadales bacterium]
MLSSLTRRVGTALAACWVLSGSTLAAQLTPPASGGIARLDQLLQRLAEQRRVLVIAAHPDDEDTRLLALLSRGYGAEAAYLSLSRGEGGQNLIGDELGVTLGLLRSQELVAARTVDGARQFFTRAYDFGYSRSLDETARFWPPDSILKDVVRVVRRFRPHVILSVWSGTRGDRHGQHQMAGVVARQAFDAADDAAVFPELGQEGLVPWRPLKLYRSTRFDTAATTLELATGRLDPRTGRSYHQIAMASRSQHRSQDMGQLQRTGPASTRMQLVEDRSEDGEGPGRERDIFDGIPADTSWIAVFADSLRGQVSVSRIAEAAPLLAGALRRAKALGVSEERQALLEQALAVSAGLVVDGTADRAGVVAGSELEVTVQFYNGGPHPVTIEQISVSAPSGWGAPPLHRPATSLEPGTEVWQRLTLAVPQDAVPTQPYFLQRELVESLYDWSRTPAEVKGEPFQPPLLQVAVRVSLFGTSLTLTREVSYRYRDQAVGELRRPVEVVPRIEVRLEPDRLVWSSEGPRERGFTVTLLHNASEPTAGEVGIEVDGWSVPAGQRFGFTGAGESQSLVFTLARPVGVRRSDVTLRAVARTDEGAEFDRAIRRVAYPHIRPTPWVQLAASQVRVAPISVPQLRAVGYIRGAADRVPEALGQIGLPVELLDANALARTDLSRFDAVVVGSRAYETDSALVRHNHRLLDYVEAGGLLLVQYQQYQFVRGEYAPYSLSIGFPHDRVTDQTAAVTILEPQHPAFLGPNRIREADWDGWPQERGLYFARTWHGAYTALLEMADPGMSPNRGSLLVARYGAGTYVYTGLSFFRALPAGVPGAYRLFLNLLALGSAEPRNGRPAGRR